MAQNPKKINLDVATKITPLEFPVEIKDEEENNVSSFFTKNKMLEMFAWYLVPVIYIIFTVAYFMVYGLF